MLLVRFLSSHVSAELILYSFSKTFALSQQIIKSISTQFSFSLWEKTTIRIFFKVLLIRKLHSSFCGDSNNNYQTQSSKANCCHVPASFQSIGRLTAHTASHWKKECRVRQRFFYMRWIQCIWMLWFFCRLYPLALKTNHSSAVGFQKHTKLGGFIKTRFQITQV